LKSLGITRFVAEEFAAIEKLVMVTHGGHPLCGGPWCAAAVGSYLGHQPHDIADDDEASGDGSQLFV